MSRPFSPPGFVEAFDKCHEELGDLLEALARRLQGPPWQNSMIPSLLESLVLHLESHFENEESDCFFEQLVKAAPWVASDVQQLAKEHRQMLLKAADLANRARKGPRSDEHWSDLMKTYSELKHDVEKHERTERRLLQQVYQHDLGTQD